MADFLLIVLFSLAMMGAASSSVLGPFLPTEIKNKDINDTINSVIFGVTPFISALASPLIGMILSKIGRKKMMLVSASLQASRVVCFTFITYLSKESFIIVAIISRVIQGLGSAGSSISLVAILSSIYKDRMEKLYGKMHIMNGFAMILGPVIGLGLFMIGGFSAIFYGFSVVYWGLIIWAGWVLPPDEVFEMKKKPLSWRLLLEVKTVPLNCFLIFIASGSLGAIEPLLSPYLSEEFDLSHLAIISIFIIPTLAYPFSVTISQKYFSSTSKKLKMSTGLGIVSLSLFFIGPCEYTGLSPQPLLTVISIILMSLGLGIIFIPALPDMVENANKELPAIESDLISDRISGIISFSASMGKGIFTVLAGIFSDKFNTKNAFSAIGLIGIAYLCIYLFFTISMMKNSQDSQKLLSENELIETKLPQNKNIN